ncbi:MULTISPECIES: hypothetical protein [Bacteroides]|uniref:hypothetical protein n=1 Tax=Bacteroides TaxID=816 RepID=UPI0004B86279|nr:hypothetical protein [Bacteroides neonati]
MVEFVDLYPTLCELCELPIPEKQLDGTSIVPVLNNLRKEWKTPVYIQWNGGDNAVSKRFNYAEWNKADGSGNRMLFDHRLDKQEDINRAEEPKYSTVIQSLSSFLKEKKEKNQ